MRVEWAIACRYAEVHDGLATIVGAGIDHLGVSALPAQLNVLFVVRMAAAPSDAGRTHTFSVTVLDPSMQQVGQAMTGQIGVPPGPIHKQPGWEGHQMQPMMVGFEAAVEGCFTIVFDVAGTSTQVPIVVELPAGQP